MMSDHLQLRGYTAAIRSSVEAQARRLGRKPAEVARARLALEPSDGAVEAYIRGQIRPETAEQAVTHYDVTDPIGDHYAILEHAYDPGMRCMRTKILSPRFASRRGAEMAAELLAGGMSIDDACEDDAVLREEDALEETWDWNEADPNTRGPLVILMQEAVEAGDRKRALLCVKALRGDTEATKACLGERA